MHQPVLAGGERRSWRRRLRIPFDSRGTLKTTHATVEFRDVDSCRHSNRWPKLSDEQLPEHDTDDD